MDKFKKINGMAKSIMIQGTMSNAGKSLVTAGLCRVFKQDGYRTAPFKSQNMALNSYITEDGLEIGRAQAVQAEAAGIKPSVHMNPILLKPTTEMGSQVIVNGEVLGNMNAADYFKHKKMLVKDIMNAYNTLSELYDIIVIEGAGSPAEINLKNEDIVNMGMAKMANAPVLLVGDIDRGGVFAQLYGTVMLLTEDEKAMIKGLMVNKFRGDVTILKSGLDMIEEKIGIPIIGTIPYVPLDIDDEDSLSERFNSSQMTKIIDIAVIRLPYVSNFTDLNPFERFEHVSLRYVKSVKELKEPDMIIIPGTKSTVSDLLWLRQSGLEGAILRAGSNGAVIFGICGGFQMLGQEINDPFETESQIKNIKGMGLLPIHTTFEKEKTRKQISGVIQNVEGILDTINGLTFEGYEIHMGKSGDGYEDVILTSENVYGTYVHGIFDGEGIASEIIAALCRKKNIEPENITVLDMKAYKEEQYDKLAEIIRNSLDMDKIYEILNEGGEETWHG